MAWCTGRRRDFVPDLSRQYPGQALLALTVNPFNIRWTLRHMNQTMTKKLSIGAVAMMSTATYPPKEQTWYRDP